MKIVNNQKYNNIPFYIILISIIISIFLMFNISYRNNKSEQEKYVRPNEGKYIVYVGFDAREFNKLQAEVDAKY